MSQKALTPCTKGPYPWVPANCMEIGGQWYMLINWRDADGGWRGRSICGTELFCDIENQYRLAQPDLF